MQPSGIMHRSMESRSRDLEKPKSDIHEGEEEEEEEY